MQHFDEEEQWRELTKGWDRDSLRKWNAFCQVLASVRGPNGIMLDTIDPSKMENPEMRRQYGEVKTKYDALLGSRKVLNTHIDDLAVKVLDASKRERIVGYSFFIQCADWTPEMRAEERKRRMEQAEFRNIFSRHARSPENAPVPRNPPPPLRDANPDLAQQTLDSIRNGNVIGPNSASNMSSALAPPARPPIPETALVSPGRPSMNAQTESLLQQLRNRNSITNPPASTSPPQQASSQLSPEKAEALRELLRPFMNPTNPNGTELLLDQLRQRQLAISAPPKIVAPTMGANGGFFRVYSDCLPAVIINSLIPQVKSQSIDLHVIHRGFKHVDNCDIHMSELILSEPFQNAAKQPVRPGTVRRICTWYALPDHVLMLVWDTFCAPNMSMRSVCYSVDCAEDFNTKVLLNHFHLLVAQHFYFHMPHVLEIWDNLISQHDIRVEHGGLICVSFVARATIYLSMVIDPILRKDYIREMSHFDQGNRLEAFLYKCFEQQLFNFVKEQTDNRKLLMFAPDKMFEYYVNSKDVKFILESSGSGGGKVIRRVYYGGVQDGFSVEGRTDACLTQSHFCSPFFPLGYP